MFKQPKEERRPDRPDKVIEIHHHYHNDPAVERKLDAILSALSSMETKMSAELDALTAEVERNTQVDQSVIALVNGLADQIEQLKNEPAKLQALAESLRSSNQAVADSVTAHTPAEPPPA